MSEKPLGNRSLTAIILTLNNADSIAKCINSVNWADEIVVYDSGSSDGTQSIVNNLGAKLVVDTEWAGFGAQRQKAQTHAKGDWLLWIDSDEIVTQHLAQNIQRCFTQAEKTQAFSLNRVSDFFGRLIRHSGWHPDRVVRLYARESYRYNNAVVHEKVDCPDDKVELLDGDLLHYTSNSFSNYMTKSLRYANDWAKQKHSEGKKVSIAGIILRTKLAFLKKYILKRGFLDGKHGFLLASQSSHYTFNKYFALWILHNRSHSQDRDLS